MKEKWRFILLILTTFMALSSIIIILYVALVFEIKLSVGAVIVSVFWAIWFKQTGWFFLSEELRARIVRILPFY